MTRVTSVSSRRASGCYGEERHRYLVEGVGLLPHSRIRIWPVVIFTCAIFVLLAGRLTQLTIVEGSYQRGVADANRLAAIRSNTARGVFFDRNQKTLVRNIPHYKRQIPDSTVAQGAFEALSREEARDLKYQPGERVFYDVSREYTCGEACSVLLGYTGEANRVELDQNTEYVMGDIIGKMGLEKLFESRVKGVAGSELLEVNASGKMVRTIGRVEEVAGSDIALALYMDLQTRLYDLFEGRKGAAVAQIPQTGEILALVSSPGFDPQAISHYLDSDDQPFFNRAIGGTYPPGSVYKIVTAVAGLEEGVITPQSEYEDTGEIVIDDYSFGNWLYHEYGRTEGHITITRALQRSNDIYFYHLGGDLGVNKLAHWSRLFGMGSTTQLAALGEKPGLIPDPVWKERTRGERWYLGNTYHMSIGQGDVTTTPLQINRMMGAIAAGGVLCPPLLETGAVGKESCTQLNLEDSTLKAVREGLELACKPGGTGAPFFNAPYTVACKTGTAQAGEGNDPHAWFTVYAPAQNPTIALTVMLENAGQGSEEAAPIAREAIDYWLAQQ